MKINKSIFKKVAIAMSLVIAMGAANLAFHETTVEAVASTVGIINTDTSDPWGLTFSVDDSGNATIVGMTRPGPGALNIPEKVSDGAVDYTVVAIEDYGSKGGVFYGTDIITSVTFPKTVTKIGNQAFGACKNITDVDLNSVTYIGYLAFGGCNKLENITNLENVQTIGEGAFGSTYKLTSIDISSATSIGQYAFRRSGINTLIIPESVETIGKNAFWECSSLTTVEYNAAMEEIPEGIFNSCTNLETINFGKEDYTAIGEKAFYDNKNMKSIEIPENVTTIGKEAFAKFNGEIHINSAKLENMNLDTMAFNGSDSVSFYTDSNLSNYDVLNSLTGISNYTLYAPITFDSNGGTAFNDGFTNSETHVKFYEKGTDIGEEITAPSATREGFTFTGWYSDMAATEATKVAGAGSLKLTQTVPSTLYAGWVPTTTYYDVTFDTDGANEVIPTQTVKDGDLANKPDPDPTKDDYTFDGWKNTEGNEFDFEKTIINQDTTLTAKWVSNIAPTISHVIVDNEVGKTLTWEEFVKKQSITAVDKDENPVEVTSDDFSNIDFNTIGEYGITLLAVDEDGNTTEEPLIVKVTDTEAPVITTSTVTLEVGTGSAMLYNTLLAQIGAVITDNYDKNLPINNVGFDAVDFSTAGDYVVQLKGQDLSGNIANSVSVTVTVSELGEIIIPTPTPRPTQTTTTNNDGETGTTQNVQIIAPETVPLSAATVNLGDRTVTAEQTADDENVYLIVDEDGTPLGTVEVVPPFTIEEINIEENMVPLAAPIMKKNPETSNNTASTGIIILFGTLAITSLSLRKKSIKN